MRQNNTDFSIISKEAVKNRIALYKKPKRPYKIIAKSNSRKPNTFTTSRTPKTLVKTAI
jgi:hypothetical protein